MDLPRDGPQRIVSLVPGATELLYVLGLWDRVVAVSHECDFPPQASKLPRASRPRVNPHLGPDALDAAVKSLVAKGESLYELDAELLRKLRPDLIIVQDDCKVCAVTPQDVQRLKLKPEPKVESFGARSWDDVLAEIRRLGKLLGASDEAKHELFKQWGLAKEIRRRVEGLPRPRVAVLDWVGPLMAAGHWTREFVEMAGGEYSFVDTRQPSRTIDWKALRDVDVIIAAPCGRTLQVAADEFAAGIREHKQWSLPANVAGRLFAADGNSFFNRPGPRLVYSAAILARCLHGDKVPPLPGPIEAGFAALHVPASRGKRS